VKQYSFAQALSTFLLPANFRSKVLSGRGPLHREASTPRFFAFMTCWLWSPNRRPMVSGQRHLKMSCLHTAW